MACSNTCRYARNGVCEDGSPLVRRGPPAIGSVVRDDPAVRVRCAWATDCADCGEQEWRQHRTAALHQVLPQRRFLSSDVERAPNISGIDLLVAPGGFPVHAAWTVTQPPFIMPFTDPSRDLGVSRSMSTARAIEPEFNLFWHRLGDRCCASGGVVLDVGANFGYYALFAAVMGCRVVAWEPVPAFRAFLEIGAQLNNVSHRIHIRSAVVTDVASAGKDMTLAVPTGGIFGTASLATEWAKGGSNVDSAINAHVAMVHARSETIDAVLGDGESSVGSGSGVGSSSGGSGGGGGRGGGGGDGGSERACLLKVDVEGHEPQVMRGAARLLATAPPRALLFEYTPGVVERARKWSLLPGYASLLASLRSAGYRLWHLGGLLIRSTPSRLPCVRGGRTVIGCDWRGKPLPALREVGAAAVAAEGRNVRNMLDEIETKTFHVPWDLHPHSLHAEFGHNTDLVGVHRSAAGAAAASGRSAAAADGIVIPADGEVGVRESSHYGLGGGVCADVQKDGTVLELVGRLCLPHGRRESIASSAAHAERPRTLQSGRDFFRERRRNASRWRFDGPCHFAVVAAAVSTTGTGGSGGGGGGGAFASGGALAAEMVEEVVCAARRIGPGLAGLGFSTHPDGFNRIATMQPSFARVCPKARLNHTVVALNGMRLSHTRMARRGKAGGEVGAARPSRLEEEIDPGARCYDVTIALSTHATADQTAAGNGPAASGLAPAAAGQVPTPAGQVPAATGQGRQGRGRMARWEQHSRGVPPPSVPVAADTAQLSHELSMPAEAASTRGHLQQLSFTPPVLHARASSTEQPHHLPPRPVETTPSADGRSNALSTLVPLTALASTTHTSTALTLGHRSYAAIAAVVLMLPMLLPRAIWRRCWRVRAQLAARHAASTARPRSSEQPASRRGISLHAT